MSNFCSVNANLHSMKSWLLFTFLALSCAVAHAQIVNADGKGVVYNSEFTIDVRLHTNGWSLGYNKAEIVQFDRIKFQGIEIGEIKHPKQDRRTFDLLAFGSNNNDSRSYIYGKQNNLFFIKYNIGQKRYLTDKAERKGAVFGISYSAGPTLGLVKPYLVEVVETEIGANGALGRDVVAIQYDGTNDDVFLDPNEVVGPAGISKGWGDLKVQPGLHAKAAIHLDWGAFDQVVKGFEMGLMVDFFFKEVPIMIIEDNSQLFLNLYINAHIGRRK